jgi:nucleotide-binding universal stress UspA family protein
MKHLLAAIDTSASASVVLATARRLGELTGAAVEAVHVREGSTDLPRWLAAQSGVPMRVLEGPIRETLIEAVGRAGVDAAVLGARAVSSGEREAIGRNALGVLAATDKPIAVVPPEMRNGRQLFRRLLLPMEGHERSSAPVVETLRPLIVPEVELVVLHVFTAATLPPVLDRPDRDLAMWGTEFLARNCPNASRIELRTGSIASRVNDVCQEEHADLIVLSWSQNLSPGRAEVVRDVMSHSTVPVLLIPAISPQPHVD